jgi:hypothetical protein
MYLMFFRLSHRPNEPANFTRKPADFHFLPFQLSGYRIAWTKKGFAKTFGKERKSIIQ